MAKERVLVRMRRGGRLCKDIGKGTGVAIIAGAGTLAR